MVWCPGDRQVRDTSFVLKNIEQVIIAGAFGSYINDTRA